VKRKKRVELKQGAAKEKQIRARSFGTGIKRTKRNLQPLLKKKGGRREKKGGEESA